ncbi:MAG: hypothetical protein M5R38_00995 [Candidatus Methylomirabilis sp.]|nr:hypothetical protein [Candidatus Methylomirabilis sp.]
MGLLQRAIEAEGIPTIGITLQKEVTKKVKPPRALYLRYPLVILSAKPLLSSSSGRSCLMRCRPWRP